MADQPTTTEPPPKPSRRTPPQYAKTGSPQGRKSRSAGSVSRRGFRQTSRGGPGPSITGTSGKATAFDDVQRTTAAALATPVDTKRPQPSPSPAPAGMGGGGASPGRSSDRWYNRRVTTAALGTPTRGTTLGRGSAGTGTFHLDKATSAHLIMISMGVSAVAVVVNGRGIPAAYVGNTRVPGNMRGYAAVIVLGTLSLVVNELSSDLGMLAAVGMVFVALADTTLFTRIGNLFGGIGVGGIPPTSPTPTGPTTGPMTPSSPGPGAQPGGGVHKPA